MQNVRFLLGSNSDFIYRPAAYLGPTALDSTPSEACKKYHESYCIQIHFHPELKNKFLQGEGDDREYD